MASPSDTPVKIYIPLPKTFHEQKSGEIVCQHRDMES